MKQLYLVYLMSGIVGLFTLAFAEHLLPKYISIPLGIWTGAVLITPTIKVHMER
jgi:hypothetical protein